jgi:hypothetical protein
MGVELEHAGCVKGGNAKQMQFNPGESLNERGKNSGRAKRHFQGASTRTKKIYCLFSL